MEIETLILGAGAAGLFCAAHCGPGALVIDHAASAGEKIRISGGGRCNFTNINAGPGQFISANRHFAKSALRRYGARDFLALVEARGIGWHEKTLGQLFCDHSAKDIVSMLCDMVAANGADLWLRTETGEIGHDGERFRVVLRCQGLTTIVRARHLVVATGGKSIPKMGASNLAYQIARIFGHGVTETRPALVPLTVSDGSFADLAGVSLPVRAKAAQGPSFDEAMLFTHRGLSGPAILQISSFWREGEDIEIDLLPGLDLAGRLRAARKSAGKRQIGTVLAENMPNRLADHLARDLGLTGTIGDQSDAAFDAIAAQLSAWRLRPAGSEGYRTAEVTLGGIGTDRLSSSTMMSRTVDGLFFIGECVDVTGWLGGYNFQWAWSSAHAAALAIAARVA